MVGYFQRQSTNNGVIKNTGFDMAVSIRVLSDSNLQSLLDLQQVIACVEAAYVEKSRKQARLFGMVTEEIHKGRAEMDIKSGVIQSERVFGLKLVSWFSENAQKGLPNITGMMMLFDLATGLPKAMLNANYLTAMRTGAAGALGIKHLANKESTVLLLIGTGGQAVFQIAATLSAVPRIDRVLILDPLDYCHAVEFQQKIKCELRKIPNDFQDLGNSKWFQRIESTVFEAVDSAKVALKDAQVVITVTPSRKPLIYRSWVLPGTHFSCVGADMEGKQEIESRIFSTARVFVDDVTQATACGETQHAFREGLVTQDHLIEMGDLILNGALGRQSAEDITIFDTTGIALQDLMVASHAVNKAEMVNIGTLVEL